MTAAFEGSMLEWESPMYREAVGQFDRVARLMGLDDNVAAVLDLIGIIAVAAFHPVGIGTSVQHVIAVAAD